MQSRKSAIYRHFARWIHGFLVRQRLENSGAASFQKKAESELRSGFDNPTVESGGIVVHQILKRYRAELFSSLVSEVFGRIFRLWRTPQTDSESKSRSRASPKYFPPAGSEANL
ncbi:MAG: hypothetical protein J2P21_17540 [Chloracidobacterium sp.]|nr:hypothetical protein [Chloracidobacterium sp.]